MNYILLSIAQIVFFLPIFSVLLGCFLVVQVYSFLQYLLEPMLLLGPVDIYIMNINVDKIWKGNI